VLSHVASVSAFFLSFKRIKEDISKRHLDHHTLYGLSPVWILLCRTNWLGFWKHLWHVSHLWTKVLRSMFLLWLLCDSEALTWNKQTLVTDEHNVGHLTKCIMSCTSHTTYAHRIFPGLLDFPLGFYNQKSKECIQ
jgi:uncharacterized membrane protein